jgi:hypothetical protein
MTRSTLIERNGCIFVEDLLNGAHGFDHLDAVGQEAFVNHVHLGGRDRKKNADSIISEWTKEMRANWKGRVFRIYRDVNLDEIVIRFHLRREGVPNWFELGIEITEIET